MDKNFKFTLSGWKLFLCFGLPFIALMVFYFYSYYTMVNNAGEISKMLNFFAVYFIFIIGIYLLYYVVIRLVINHISHKLDNFEFHGSFRKCAWIFIRDGILSIATLGIYSFWFAENIIRYFVENTSFGIRTFSFNAKGGELLKRFLIYYLPFLIIYIFGIGISHFGSIGLKSESAQAGEMFSLMVPFIIYFIIFLFGNVLYMYKLLEWVINLNCEEFNLSLETEFWPTIGFILKQFGLIVVTFGLFYPAALANFIKYIINHLYITNGEREISIRNQVDTTSSWGYIFGQYVLSVITLYVYLPWAIVRILRWFIESTEFEGFEQPENLPYEDRIDEEKAKDPDRDILSGDATV